MKEYEGWIKEDEEDFEGERIISDIKNLYVEQYFNVGFTEKEDVPANYIN